MIKKFESFDENKTFHPDWKEDFLTIYDLFCELEDLQIGKFDYQAGVRYSSISDQTLGKVSNSFQYPVFLKDGETFGREDFIDNAHWGKLCFRVSINVEFEHNNYSPFRTQYSASYFGQNADKLLEIMSKVNVVKKRIPKYDVGITLDGKFIIINFLAK